MPQPLKDGKYVIQLTTTPKNHWFWWLINLIWTGVVTHALPTHFFIYMVARCMQESRRGRTVYNGIAFCKLEADFDFK